jgi:hypothetical protein
MEDVFDVITRSAAPARARCAGCILLANMHVAVAVERLRQVSSRVLQSGGLGTVGTLSGPLYPLRAPTVSRTDTETSTRTGFAAARAMDHLQAYGWLLLLAPSLSHANPLRQQSRRREMGSAGSS